VLLGLAVVQLVVVPVLVLATGGFATELLGQRVSLHGVAKPLLVGLSLLLAWAVLAPGQAGLVKERLDRAPERARTAVAWGIGTTAALALSFAKLTQHAVFQTGAFDLGLQASVAWNTAYGRPFHDSVQEMSYLGDHFSPVHLGLAAVYRLWPDARSLLVAQSIALGLALVAVCRIAGRHLGAFSWAVLVTVLFAFNPYLHRVSAFDFHPVALAIPLFLWLLERIDGGGRVSVALLAVLAATVEETLLPPLVGIGLYVAWVRRDLRSTGLAIALGAALLFAVEVGVLMPYFLGENRLTHIHRYANLGRDLGDVLRTIADDPLVLAREWVSPPDKVAELARLLASFGFLPLLAPLALAMALIPIAIVQVGHYRPGWAFEGQYAATALPLLAFAAIHGLVRLRRIVSPLHAWRRRASSPEAATRAAALGIALALAWEVAGSPRYVRPWSAEHVAAAKRMVASVPPGVSVCAAQYLVPHFADRAGVTMLRPDGRGGVELDDAEAVLIDTRADDRRAWPFTADELREAVPLVLADPRYRVVQEAEGLVLLRHFARRSEPPSDPR
jgi:uncharacterized membrane protein